MKRTELRRKLSRMETAAQLVTKDLGKLHGIVDEYTQAIAPELTDLIPNLDTEMEINQSRLLKATAVVTASLAKVRRWCRDRLDLLPHDEPDPKRRKVAETSDRSDLPLPNKPTPKPPRRKNVVIDDDEDEESNSETLSVNEFENVDDVEEETLEQSEDKNGNAAELVEEGFIDGSEEEDFAAQDKAAEGIEEYKAKMRRRESDSSLQMFVASLDAFFTKITNVGNLKEGKAYLVRRQDSDDPWVLHSIKKLGTGHSPIAALQFVMSCDIPEIEASFFEVISVSSAVQLSRTGNEFVPAVIFSKFSAAYRLPQISTFCGWYRTGFLYSRDYNLGTKRMHGENQRLFPILTSDTDEMMATALQIVEDHNDVPKMVEEIYQRFVHPSINTYGINIRQILADPTAQVARIDRRKVRAPQTDRCFLCNNTKEISCLLITKTQQSTRHEFLGSQCADRCICVISIYNVLSRMLWLGPRFSKPRLGTAVFEVLKLIEFYTEKMNATTRQFDIPKQSLPAFENAEQLTC